jgi:hypothetical protein
MTKFLSIEAWTTPVKLRRSTLTTSGYPSNNVFADIGPEGHACSFLAKVNNFGNDSENTEAEETEVYDAIGIPLSDHTAEQYPRRPVLILVERQSFWERVGLSFLYSQPGDYSCHATASKKNWLKLERRKIRLG